MPALPSGDLGESLQVTQAQVLRSLQQVNPRKAAGPDGVSPRVLKACAAELAEVYTDIFNSSLAQAVVPLLFKKSIIIPWHSVAMKCLEKLVLKAMDSIIPITTDPLQFAYRKNRSVDDTENCLALNTDKTKELILDFRKKLPPYKPCTSKRVESMKFLGLHITNTLSWSENTTATVKKAQQRLYFIRSLRKAGLSCQPLTQAYRCLVESVLTGGITVWYGNTTVKEKALQRIIKTAQRIIGAELPSMDTLYTIHCRNKIKSILQDPHHPSHTLFRWRSSSRVLRHHRPESIRAKRKRFHYPAAIRLLAEDIQAGLTNYTPSQTLTH
ncbi:hypothetical protein N1851_012331 [Merluccius polli]|uniref:Alkylated DNA repair protein AlkB homologue 8 N-terminal domain-containing protein n=1 Tax=Merluccius polli TaxID=89951 RepID=A0AA47MX91_MERPO|nr:hypothetical protein N1851_012331 [Merluccius polli]